MAQKTALSVLEQYAEEQGIELIDAVEELEYLVDQEVRKPTCVPADPSYRYRLAAIPMFGAFFDINVHKPKKKPMPRNER